MHAVDHDYCRSFARMGSDLRKNSARSEKMATAITDLHFDINTKGDDKDRGEAINIQIIKDGTVVVYDSGWIHDDLIFHNDSYNDWRAPWAGTGIRVPITLEDCPKLKLRVEKRGDKGWQVSFRVRANNDALILLDDTPTVQFGKRNPVEISKPLEGVHGIKVEHSDGGSFHTFGFTCRA
jgi:hypothetical protein